MYCIGQFGHLDDIQRELNATHPDLDIQILGMNQAGLEIGNPNVTEGHEIPWVQDVDSDNDGKSDHWLNTWDYAYRDVVIVDANNVPQDVYNLTVNDLGVQSNRDQLTQLILDTTTATANAWTNPEDPLDVNGDKSISPLDALLVLNRLNSIGSGKLGERGPDDHYLDTNSDDNVSPIDALLVINRLNEQSRVSQAAVPARETTATESPTLVAAAIDEAFDEDSDSAKRKPSHLNDGSTFEV